MKKLIVVLLLTCACLAQTNIRANNGTFTGTLKGSKTNGFFTVDGSTYTTVQAAITAACATSPVSPVFIPPGTYPQNSGFTLCTGLQVIGSGRSLGDTVTCPTTITTTMTSGKLFDMSNLTDMHISDLCVKSTAVSAADSVFYGDGAQRNVVERIFIYGGGTGFNRGISLHTSSTSTASTIRNTFRDVFMTGLASSGIGCILDSSDATTKVINNNLLLMVACVGGSGGTGLKVTNSNAQQNINEDLFYGDEFATGGTGAGGTGILLTSTATRGMVFLDANVESNTTGLSKAAGNVVTFVGGNISSNSSNVSDSSSTFTSFFNTNVGGTVQQFAVFPDGSIDVTCVGLNATCTSNLINGISGWGLGVAGTQKWDINTGSIAPHIAGGSDLGSASLPIANIYVGGAATNNIKQTGTFTAARQATWPDSSGTVGWQTGTQMFFVSCNGTATASSTLTMPWPGYATTACTNASTTIQMPMASAGTAKNLRVRCGTGGSAAGSGVFTLVNGGGNTALTCTVGTGTTCNDTTHTASLSARDVLLVQYTTQGGETLANCAVSFEKQ